MPKIQKKLAKDFIKILGKCKVRLVTLKAESLSLKKYCSKTQTEVKHQKAPILDVTHV
jgi:hypothetical protein